MLQMADTEEPSKRCGDSDGDGKIGWESKGRRSRGFGFGLGLGEGLRASQFPCGVGLGNTLQLLKEDLASALRFFRAPEEGTV